MKSEKCLMCGAEDYHEITKDSYPFQKKIANYICMGCGITRINPVPKLDELREHYANYRKKTINLVEPTPEYESVAKVNAHYHYSFYADLLKKGSNILDVGCGAGTLLHCAILEGHTGYGVNPDEGFGNFGVKNYGVKEVKINLYEEAEFPEEYFDLITFNHVFEHFLNPHEALKKTKLLLKDEGLIYLSIPNSLTPHGQLEYNYFDEHIYTYTIKNITEILESHGFIIIRHSEYGMKLENGLYHPWIDLVAKLHDRNKKYKLIEQNADYARSVIEKLTRYRKKFEIENGKLALKMGIKRVQIQKNFPHLSGLNRLVARVILRIIKPIAYSELDYCGKSIQPDFPRTEIKEKEDK